MKYRISLLCPVVALAAASIGQAQTVYPISDFTFSAAQDPLYVIDTGTPGFTGFDDTYDGNVTIDFTWAGPPGLDAWNLSNSIWYLFQLHNGAVEGAFVGNAWASDRFGYYDGTLGADLLDSGASTIKPNSSNPVSFSWSIDYVAGGLDSSSITMNGGVTNLSAADYSFDNIRMRGLGDGHSLTSVSITATPSAVPEPSMLGVIFGGFALLGLATRRRIRR